MNESDLLRWQAIVKTIKYAAFCIAIVLFCSCRRIRADGVPPIVSTPRSRLVESTMTDRPDLKALAVRNEIIGFLRAALVDDGSGIDTGSGFGSEDVWFVIGGEQYHLQISHDIRKFEPVPPLSAEQRERLERLIAEQQAAQDAFRKLHR